MTLQSAGKVAIPSESSPYFTAGRAYPIVSHRAWLYYVQCDKGHLRAISMENGAPSAHLSPATMDHYGAFSSDRLGFFEIRLANHPEISTIGPLSDR